MLVSFCELGSVQKGYCAGNARKMTLTGLRQPTHCENNNTSEGLCQSHRYIGRGPNVILNDKLKIPVYHSIPVITSDCPIVTLIRCKTGA